MHLHNKEITGQAYDEAHEKAIAATDSADAEGTHDAHIAAAEAHADAAKKTVEGSTAHKLHMRLNKLHGEKANALHEKEQGKAPESPIVKEYPGGENQKGMTVRVAKLKNGKHSVTMKDEESGQVLPDGKIFDKEEDAHTHAKALAEGKPTPKPEPTEKEKNYLENSSYAMKSGNAANKASKDLKGSVFAHSPGEHKKLAKMHEQASSAHYDSAKFAPSKELAEFHDKKSQAHDAMMHTHKDAAFHHTKNNADANTVQAAAASSEALKMGTAKHHRDAAEAHEAAMNLHEDARSAAEQRIDDGDTKKSTKAAANHHSERYGQHGASALYHHSAANAVEATEKAAASGSAKDHETAALHHQQASESAKNAGLHTSAKAHNEKAIEHTAKAVGAGGASAPTEAKAAHDKAHKEANEASSKAFGVDYISHEHADSHAAVKAAYDEAASAHAEAVKTGHAAGDTESAKEHAKAMNDFSKRSDYHGAALKAVYASKAASKDEGTANEAKTHEEARAAHHEAAEKAITAHGFNSDTYKHHIGKAVEHGEKAKKAQANASAANNPGKELDAKKPYAEQNFQGRSHDAAWASEHANETGAPADHEAAAKAHKHAAVIAHHKGMTQEAGFHAAKAKHHEAQSKGVMKSVGDKEASVAIMHAARLLLRQSNQPKNFSKALSDLPAMGGLRDACLKATAAGITDPGRLIELALGGKQQALPVLAILTNGTGQ
jgi:hypothetical protein